LEIGSGHGIQTVVLANLFKTVLATEPNPVLFGALKDMIKTREISNVATTNIAAEDITLAKLEVTKKFDIICCFNSFRFIEDKDAMLDKFASLLRKTKGPGYVLISSPIKFATIDSDKSHMRRTIATIAACYRNKKFRIPFHGALTQLGNGILLKLVV
jgi:ubiquinone/menaquinone biosynthesis C-methylase UbiE